MLTRRALLKAAAGFGLATFGFTGYALGVEPWTHRIVRYRPRLPAWPQDLNLKIALVADVHACEPWMDLERIDQIVADTNKLRPDLVLLLGDYMAHHRFVSRSIPAPEWANALARLKAPLGVHAILGNHDWWDDQDAMIRGKGPVRARRALEAAGIPVYENDAKRLRKDGRSFWLAGLGDQLALRVREGAWPRHRTRIRGVDDLSGTMAQIHDDAPLLLMAHEPDIFPRVSKRVALTVAGHTHGGQVAVAGFTPIVPSRFGSRYARGHIVEGDRHLIVSAGLGCSGAPIRFGVPPEIALVELGGANA